LKFADLSVATLTGYPSRLPRARLDRLHDPAAPAHPGVPERSLACSLLSPTAEERVQRRLGNEFNHRGKENT
jgi:hypothetical protein